MAGTWLSRLLRPRRDGITAVKEAATRAVNRFQQAYGYADREDRKESLLASFLAVGVTSIFGFFSTPRTSKRLISLTAPAVHRSLSGETWIDR